MLSSLYFPSFLQLEITDIVKHCYDFEIILLVLFLFVNFFLGLDCDLQKILCSIRSSKKSESSSSGDILTISD